MKVDGHRVEYNEANFVLSGSDILESKIQKKLAIFSKVVKQEIASVGSQIKQTNINEGLPSDSMSGVVNILIEKVAELSARCSVLEGALVEKNKR